MSRILINPYEGVNWSTIKQYKGAFHIHTQESKIEADGTVIYANGKIVDTNGNTIQEGDSNWKYRDPKHPDYTNSNGVKYGSDGNLPTDEVIDVHVEHDYKVFSVSESDWLPKRTSWPWTKFHRDPEQLGVLPVDGMELKTKHHIGSVFSDVAYVSDDGVDDWERETLAEVEDSGGLSIINHPKIHRLTGPGEYSLQWYVDLFKDFKSIIGIEAYSTKYGLLGYQTKTSFWDRLNVYTGRINTAWGFANDDFHSMAEFGRSFNFLLMNDLTEAEAKSAMENGRTYFCHEPGQSGEAKTPRIQEIKVNGNEIEVIADSGYVTWHTSPDFELKRGNKIDVSNLSNFVRAVITNQYGTTYTQPFFLTEYNWTDEHNWI